jgi:hypothetical protein
MIEHMFVLDEIAEIDALRTALRARLAAIDPSSLTPGDAQRLVAQGEQFARLGAWIKARFAVASAGDEAWKREGFRSPADWLAAQHGTSKTQATNELALATQLPSLPAVDAAMAAGELPVLNARAIAEAAAVAPHEEQRLVKLAKTGTINEVAAACEKVKHAADPDPAARRERIRRQRESRVWFKDGVGHLHLSGPADEIARVANTIHDAAGKRLRAQKAAPDAEVEPIEAHRYDAAVDAILADGADTAPPPVGADAKIIMRIDHTAFLRGYSLDGEICEIAGVGPVPVSVVWDWFDAAFITAVRVKGTTITDVVHLGRKFKALQVTALQAKDPACVAKGCGKTWNVQRDHDTGWVVTHTTSTDDANHLCPECHRKKTAGWHLHPPDDDGKRELVPPHHPTHPDQELRDVLNHAADQIRRQRGEVA